MTGTAGSPASGARVAAHRLTGRRRVAFVCRADEAGLPGLLVLLRSLALTNPELCEDFVVRHDGLSRAALDRARRLHPRLVARDLRQGRDADDHGTGHGADHAAESGDESAYDTLVHLTTGMVVLGDVSALLHLRHGVAAVPQPAGSGYERTVPEDGLRVVQRTVPVGQQEPYALDARYGYPARLLYDDAPVPPHVAVLDFGADGGHRPWEARRSGYGPAEAAWHRYEMTDEAFRRAYCALDGPRHPDLLVHCAGPLLDRGAPSVNLCRAVALVHLERGRYEEAVQVLERVLDRVPADRPRFHETAGKALTAVSRYDEAETHLLLAAAAPHVAPRALEQLARLAWVRGDDAAARAYARESLDTDPVHRGCRTLLDGLTTTAEQAAAEQGAPEQRPVPDGEQLAHVALFATGQENAGDRVLPEAVRRCFPSGDDRDTGPRRWLTVPVHRVFDERALEQVNARRAVVVGGGGLFLPDTRPNGASAWQWNVSDEMLARITVPLAVFAVGYNVFDGQDYARRRFTGSLRTLAERSVFFGLRNTGSVERVRDLLPYALRDRVRWQPCPTTVARHLHPDWTDPERRADTVLLNCAYDRAGLRFGHDYGPFLGELATAVRALRDRAEVRYAAHMPADERFVHDLRREHGHTLPVDRLYDLSNDRIRALYTGTRLVIGMRGHATMIPFGCGTPVLSLVSHPKMAYFLSDIGRPEWGVSVHDPQLGAVLTERATALLDGHPAAVADVHARQARLWRVTEENLAELGKHFA